MKKLAIFSALTALLGLFSITFFVKAQAQEVHQGLPAGSAFNMGLDPTGNRGTIITPVGDLTSVNQPAANTAAVATISAGSGVIRHIATSAVVCISAVAAQGDIIFNLRDGASGAGTIKHTWRLQAPIGTSKCEYLPSGAAITGSAATAMTLESAAAPAATNFATVSLTYHNAG